jgi:flagellar FliL protein
MAPETTGTADGRKAKLMLIGILAGAAILGGSLGSMIVAPKIISAKASKTAAKSAAKEAAMAADSAAGHETKGIVYQIENIVVNPAGSQGVHFLMLSIAFEVPDAKAEAALRENDIRVRDTVIATLEGQTMEMLTQPGSRDRLKRILAEAVTPMAGGARWMNVYLPQFVIQ